MSIEFVFSVSPLVTQHERGRTKLLGVDVNGPNVYLRNVFVSVS